MAIRAAGTTAPRAVDYADQGVWRYPDHGADVQGVGVRRGGQRPFTGLLRTDGSRTRQSTACATNNLILC